MSSNEKMVMMPRELLMGVIEYADSLLSDCNRAWNRAGRCADDDVHEDPDYLRAVDLLAEPTAFLAHGEPVALPGRKPSRISNSYADGWNAYRDEMLKLGQLYTRPVQGEPATLKCWSCKSEFTLKDREDCDGCCWKCGVEIELDDYVEQLRAELTITKKLYAEASQASYDFGSMQLQIDTFRAENESLRDGWYKDESDNNRFWPEEMEELRKQVYKRDALLRKALADIEYIQKECGGDVSPGYIGCLVDDVVQLLSASAEPEVKS